MNSTKQFIQGIIDNELEACFADCSQDNIDKWVEILNRHHEAKLKTQRVMIVKIKNRIPRKKKKLIKKRMRAISYLNGFPCWLQGDEMQVMINSKGSK